MAAASTIGGLTEAIFLVLVTRAAFAITDGQESMGTLANRQVGVSTALLMMVGLVFFRILMAVCTNWLSAALSADVSAELRNRLARAFLRSTWSAQQASPAGRLQELITGFANAGASMLSSFATGVVAGCSLVAMLLLAVGVDPIGSFVAVAAVGALGSIIRPLRGRLRVQARRASNDGMSLATVTNEVSGLGMAMHVFDVRGQVEGRISGVLETHRRSSMRLGLLRGLVPAVYSGLAYLTLIGAVTMANESSSAKLTSLGAVMLVMLRSLSYGQNLQVAYSSVTSTLPAVGDVFDEIARYEKQAFVDEGSAVTEVCPLVLDDVSFHYVDGQPVLQGLMANITRGEMVGIVGPSGSGKSTLVQLLLGLREPVDGAVRAGGRDIRTLLHSDWAKKVTFVPQSPALISGSIAENIRFYRDGISDEAVTRAATLAGLHEEVVAFPDGYDHQVGDRGGNLSGGQQQRLCIARALVGNPEVLILDEPTSALDARSEALIRETLESLRGQMTIIVIAHRLSTIDQCDRIMVIQHGSVAAFDTPAALKATSNFYAEAVRLSGLS